MVIGSGVRYLCWEWVLCQAPSNKLGFCSLLLAMVTSLYEWNILEQDTKTIDNHDIFKSCQTFDKQNIQTTIGLIQIQLFHKPCTCSNHYIIQQWCYPWTLISYYVLFDLDLIPSNSFPNVVKKFTWKFSRHCETYYTGEINLIKKLPPIR